MSVGHVSAVIWAEAAVLAIAPTLLDQVSDLRLSYESLRSEVLIFSDWLASRV